MYEHIVFLKIKKLLSVELRRNQHTDLGGKRTHYRFDIVVGNRTFYLARDLFARKEWADQHGDHIHVQFPIEPAGVVADQGLRIPYQFGTTTNPELVPYVDGID